MPDNNNICRDHSGCLTRLDHLELENSHQWRDIISMKEKYDSILTRINVTLGSIVVACILLIINILIK